MAINGNHAQWAETIADDSSQEDFALVSTSSDSGTCLTYRDVIVAAPYTKSDYAQGSYQILSVKTQKPSATTTTTTKHQTVPNVFQLQKTIVQKLPERFLTSYGMSVLPKYLSECIGQDAQRTLTVIVSIKSGAEEAAPFFEGIVRPTLDALDIKPASLHVHFTDSEQSIRTLVAGPILARAQKGLRQTILLLSGDGGIVDTVNALFTLPTSPDYAKPTIGLLVLGTGNALANSSGLNQDNTRGLRTFLRGQPATIPTFVTRFAPGAEFLVDEARRSEPVPADANGEGLVHGAVVTSWCLHASLVADSDTTAYRKHGSKRFVMAAEALLTPPDESPSHVYRGQIMTWSRDSSNGNLVPQVWPQSEHMYLLVTLVSHLESNLTISPDAKPLDGQLRVLHFDPMSAADIMAIFGKAYAGGGHIESPGVTYEPIEALRVQVDETDARWRRVCVDGKIVRLPENGWFEVRRQQREVAELVVSRQT